MSHSEDAVNPPMPDSRFVEAESVPPTTAKPRADISPPPPEDFDREPVRRQPRQDDLQHLRLLSIFHYVVAGLAALFGLFPIIHLAIGIAIVSGSIPASGGSPPPPRWFGTMFIVVPGLFIVLLLGLAVALVIAGRLLQQRRGYLFCLIVAGISMLFQPFGMVLGILTIIVLLRPSVKELFGRKPSAM